MRFGLAGRCRRLGDGRDRHGPDVPRSIGIDVPPTAHAVCAIHGTGDDFDVGLARFLRFVVFGGRFRIELLRKCARRERDRLAVRGPLRIASAARNVGDRASFATGHGDDVDLWRLNAAVLFSCPGEGQPGAVGRPSRRVVASAPGQSARRFTAVALRDPDRRIGTDRSFRRPRHGQTPPATRPERSAGRRPTRT